MLFPKIRICAKKPDTPAPYLDKDIEWGATDRLDSAVQLRRCTETFLVWGLDHWSDVGIKKTTFGGIDTMGNFWGQNELNCGKKKKL